MKYQMMGARTHMGIENKLLYKDKKKNRPKSSKSISIKQYKEYRIPSIWLGKSLPFSCIKWRRKYSIPIYPTKEKTKSKRNPHLYEKLITRRYTDRVAINILHAIQKIKIKINSAKNRQLGAHKTSTINFFPDAAQPQWSPIKKKPRPQRLKKKKIPLFSYTRTGAHTHPFPKKK